MGIEYRRLLPLTALSFALAMAITLTGFDAEAESAEDKKCSGRGHAGDCA